MNHSGSSLSFLKVLTWLEGSWMVRKGPERNWKVLKCLKMFWNVRKCTRISKRSLNSRRYGMLCVLLLGQKKFLGQKIFWVKKYSGPKYFWIIKVFGFKVNGLHYLWISFVLFFYGLQPTIIRFSHVPGLSIRQAMCWCLEMSMLIYTWDLLRIWLLSECPNYLKTVKTV